jgi:hypothetical protein
MTDERFKTQRETIFGFEPLVEELTDDKIFEKSVNVNKQLHEPASMIAFI